MSKTWRIWLLVTAVWTSTCLQVLALPAPVRYSTFRDKEHGPAVRVHLVEVNLNDPRVNIDLVMAKGQASTVETVNAMARRHRAVAAINGSFFHGTTMDSSVGLVIKEGEIISDSGHRRTSLGITRDKKFVMGVPKVQTGLYFPDQDKFQRLNGVNQPRKNHQTIVYTPRFGAYTHTNKWGREVVVEHNKVVRYSYGNTQIPRNGFIISAHGKGKEIQEIYPLGAEVQLTTQSEYPWEDTATIFTGAPHLVKNGRIYNTYFQEKLQSSLKSPNSRSAVGLTHNNKLLMVNVFPEKGSNTRGVTFTRLAHIMRRLGAQEAMALDGGGSTSLYVSEKALSFARRPVNNALIVKLK